MSAAIIVTGSNGQLGSELRALSESYPEHEFVFLGREEFPLSGQLRAEPVFERYHPAFFINCAAYTAVDRAESEPELANDINGAAVGLLARLAKEYGTKFIHISTDYVFNGKGHAPLKETDATDPVNAYGASKLLGEELAMKQNPNSMILRTSWVYSAYGKNFVKTMMRLMQEKDAINVVDDQYGSPTYAADLAAALLQIIASSQWQPGIYNYSNEGVITWFRFAEEIKKLTGASCTVNPIPTSQFPTPAERPLYSVLDKSKIQQAFGLELKDWKHSLETCTRKLIADGL